MKNATDLINVPSQLSSIRLLIRTHLWAQILVAMVLGITIGTLVSPHGYALMEERNALILAEWLALPGRIFLAIIQMVVIPLILTSVILGIASGGDVNQLGRIGGRALLFFVVTTLIATFIGIGLAVWIEPGLFIDRALVDTMLAQSTVDVRVPSKDIEWEIGFIPHRLAEIIPANARQAMAEQNMLQVVVYALFLGAAVAAVERKKVQTVLDFLNGFLEVVMKVVSWAMMLAPYAVFGLLAQISIKTGTEMMGSLSAYVGTVILGLVVLLGFYLFIVAVIGKKNPFNFLQKIKDVQLLAFSTCSSAATLPLTIKTGEEVLKLPSSIVRMILSLGATVNMAGTALYQVTAAVFLTQVFGIELGIGGLLILSLTVVGASIGAPSTPGVSIVILSTIMANLGVPAEGIALIIGVDRILDMLRTSINVTGDLAACEVTNRWLGGEEEKQSL